MPLLVEPLQHLDIDMPELLKLYASCAEKLAF